MSSAPKRVRRSYATHRSPIRRGRVRQSRGGIRRHHQHRRRRNSPTFTRAQANAMPRLRQVQPVVAYAFRMIASPGTRSGPPAASGSTQAPCHYALDDMTVLVAGEAELPNPTRAVGLKRDAKGWFRLPRPRQAVPLRPSNNRAERLHRRPDGQEEANQGKEFFHLSSPPSSCDVHTTILLPATRAAGSRDSRWRAAAGER